MKGNFSRCNAAQVFSSTRLNGCGWSYLMLLEPEQATSLSLTLGKQMVLISAPTQQQQQGFNMPGLTEMLLIFNTT